MVISWDAHSRNAMPDSGSDQLGVTTSIALFFLPPQPIPCPVRSLLRRLIRSGLLLSCLRILEVRVYCSQCSIDYPEGFSECPDCHLPLIARTVSPDPNLELVVVFE